MKENLSKLNNQDNFANYDDLTDSNFRRGRDQDEIKAKLHKTNWAVESQYHNTYYHGNGKYGTRTIKMSNKQWHKINKNQ